jgi:hypothetical protein
MPAARKRYFISYSRTDKNFVDPLVKLLRTAPTDVFFTATALSPVTPGLFDLSEPSKEHRVLLFFGVITLQIHLGFGKNGSSL